jgi:outer membrane protein assembly factor BamB
VTTLPRPREVTSIPGPSEYMCGLTWSGTRLWHSDQQAGQLYALDREDGRVQRQLRCASVRADLAWSGTHLWQIGMRPKRFLVLAEDDGAQVGRVAITPSNGRVTGAEFAPDGIWMLLRAPQVLQLRTVVGDQTEIVRELGVPGEHPSGLTYADGTVYYGDFDQRLIRGLDVSTGEVVLEYPTAGSPTGLAWDGELLWYCDFQARRLRALDVSA